MITWSYSKNMCSFIRPSQAVFHFSFPPGMNESSCFSASSLAFGRVTILEFSISSRCVVLSHHYFKFQFPHGLWCWASFHIYHLHMFFGEASVQIFCPVLNWIFLFSYCRVLRFVCVLWVQVLYQVCARQRFLYSSLTRL